MDKRDPSEAEDRAVLMSIAARLSSELSEAADALNASIVAVEDQFAKLKLGVTAWVDFPLPEDEDPEWERSLIFGKMGDKWRLIVDAGPVTDPRRVTSTPLLNANKELRLAAIDFFDELLGALVQEAAKQRNEILNKAKQAEAFALSVAEGAQTVGVAVKVIPASLSAPLKPGQKL